MEEIRKKKFWKNLLKQIPKDICKKMPGISSGIKAFEETEKQIKEEGRDKSIMDIHLKMDNIQDILMPRKKLKNEQISRSEKKIIKELEEIENKIWFDRHQMLKNLIKSGKMKVDQEIWEGAIKAEKQMIKKYGRKELGPWTNFEWGMLNGKLSALRWLFGEKWDTLDS